FDWSRRHTATRSMTMSNSLRRVLIGGKAAWRVQRMAKMPRATREEPINSNMHSACWYRSWYRTEGTGVSLQHTSPAQASRFSELRLGRYGMGQHKGAEASPPDRCANRAALRSDGRNQAFPGHAHKHKG